MLLDGDSLGTEPSLWDGPSSGWSVGSDLGLLPACWLLGAPLRFGNRGESGAAWWRGAVRTEPRGAQLGPPAVPAAPQILKCGTSLKRRVWIGAPQTWVSLAREGRRVRASGVFSKPAPHSVDQLLHQRRACRDRRPPGPGDGELQGQETPGARGASGPQSRCLQALRGLALPWGLEQAAASATLHPPAPPCSRAVPSLAGLWQASIPETGSAPCVASCRVGLQLSCLEGRFTQHGMVWLPRSAPGTLSSRRQGEGPAHRVPPPSSCGLHCPGPCLSKQRWHRVETWHPGLSR